MRTAYLTLDEVNACDAIQIGARRGHAVHLVDLRSANLAAEAHLILDVDYLPPDDAHRLMNVLAPALKGRLAVHGYNLSPATIGWLVQAGVVVRRRLDQTLFHRLGTRPRVLVTAP
jgi:hypothetical protein